MKYIYDNSKKGICHDFMACCLLGNAYSWDIKLENWRAGNGKIFLRISFALFNSYVNSRVTRSRLAAPLATCEYISPGVTLTNFFFARECIFSIIFLHERNKNFSLFVFSGTLFSLFCVTYIVSRDWTK